MVFIWTRYTSINRYMFAWCDRVCINILGIKVGLFPVLGVYFGQKENTCPGIFQGFCLFVKEAHFQYISLFLSWRKFLSYRNQFIDLQSKSMSWFLYDRDLRHERVNRFPVLQPETALRWILPHWYFKTKSVCSFAIEKLLTMYGNFLDII